MHPAALDEVVDDGTGRLEPDPPALRGASERESDDGDSPVLVEPDVEVTDDPPLVLDEEGRVAASINGGLPSTQTLVDLVRDVVPDAGGAARG